jgi:hypothetical protein
VAMKIKKEYIILLIVIVSLAGYLVMRSRTPSGFELPQPEALEKNKINRLLIIKNGSNIELTQKDEKWFLEPKQYPADSVKIGNMLNAVANLSLTALVSESGNYERYDLTDDKKIHVQAFAEGSQKREFDIGRAAPTFQHTFVKLSGDPNVYHAKGSLNNTFNYDTDGLRDKTVLSFDMQSINELEIQKDGQTLRISRKAVAQNEKSADQQGQEPTRQPSQADEQAGEAGKADPEAESESAAAEQTRWEDAGGQAVDKTAVEGLLSTASRLQCDEFMADEASRDLKQDQEKWRLIFKNDQEAFSITAYAAANQGDKDDTQVPAIASGTPYAFQLAQTRVKTFEQNMDTLLKINKDDEPEKTQQVKP